MRNPFKRRPVPVSVTTATAPPRHRRDPDDRHHQPPAAPNPDTVADSRTDLAAALCDKLGLPHDSPEDTIVATALAATESARTRRATRTTEFTPPAGTMLVDRTEYDALRHDAGEPARIALAQRDWAIVTAITEGRLTPHESQAVAAMWAHDPVGARQVLADRPPNTALPIAELGHSYAMDRPTHGDDDELTAQVLRGGEPR